MAMRVVDHFTIPDEIAHRLSDLLIKQSIRQNMLMNVINEPAKFEQMEELLMPIQAELNAIKRQITVKYVPEQYNDEKYSWNYDGWEISQNVVQILMDQ